MYVSRISLAGIKGFRGDRSVDLVLPARGSWTVLAGRNSSGKTTLLRAMALALVGPSVARSLVPDFSGWLSQESTSGQVRVDVVRDPRADYVLGRGKHLLGDWELGLRWIQPTGRSDDPRALRLSLGTFGHPEAAHGPWDDNPQGWFCAGYGPFRRLFGGSSEAQRLMLAPGPTARLASLFHEDASLAESVSWMIELHLRRLEHRKNAARVLEIVLSLLSDGLLPEGHKVSRIDSDGLWVLPPDRKAPHPLREMSDGYRAVTALVLDLLRQLYLSFGDLDVRSDNDGRVVIDAPGVVLIDEVDAHLHVSWQQEIAGWLRLHFPRIQFVVSSHSPYICQDADPGGLIRMAAPGEQRGPEVVDDELYRRIVFGSADDAALSELFGLDTPYSDRAEQKRRRLVVLERKVYAGTASAAETEEYRGLSSLLVSSLGTRVAEVAARLGELE
ncbi:AAA family ATPase [Kitasatospora sp. NPDC004289]